MVLDTLGKPVDLETLVKQARVGPRGTSAQNIESALRANGVSSARVRRRLTLDTLAEATAQGHPAIANVRVTRFTPNGSVSGGHAIVVDGVTTRQGQRVVAIRDPAGDIRDPAVGRQFFTPADEFMRAFTGEAVLTNPR